MYKILVTTVCLFACSANAQVRIYNNNLRDTSRNELYIGVENLVQFSGLPKKHGDLTVKVINGLSYPDLFIDDAFIVTTHNKAITDTVLLYENEVLLASRIFHVKPAGLVIGISLAGSTDTILSVAQILADPQIRIVETANLKYPNEDVLEFRLDLVHEKDTIKFHTNDSGLMRDEQLLAIGTLQAGDHLLISRTTTRPMGHKMRMRLPARRIWIR